MYFSEKRNVVQHLTNSKNSQETNC